MAGGCYVESYTNPAVGDDLATGKVWQASKRARRVVKWNLSGGAAAYDGQVELWYGQEKVGNIYNNLTNATPQLKPYAFWLSGGKRCRANDDLHVKVVTSTGSNNYYLFLDIREG